MARTATSTPTSGTSRRGFASMTAARVREVASKGGKKTAQGHDMAMIGKAGGRATAERGAEYFARIGRLGGKAGKRGKAKVTIATTPTATTSRGAVSTPTRRTGRSG